MSKSGRKDIHAGPPAGGNRWVRRVRQPERITSEWALEVMDRHLQMWLSRQVELGIIEECERDEYEAMVRDVICRAAATYNPAWTDSEGRTASAMNYIRTAADNKMGQIAKRILLQRKRFTKVPIVADPPAEAERMGCISEEDGRLGDRCRSVGELEFRMDVETLMRMLPRNCADYLKCRIGGMTTVEASRCIGLSRYVIRTEIVPALRETALACGFEPRATVEGPRPWRKKKEKSSHGLSAD